MLHTKNFIKRLKPGSLALLFLLTQASFALTPFINTSSVSALADCVVDTAGANDEPGQKDLTQLCIDDTSTTSITATWNWDETGTNGANTLDACALFDTDNDGNINYAVCVTTTDDPAVLQSTTLYSCGDAKIDRCTTPATPLTISNGTQCSVSQKDTDPFPSGASNPEDTEADCTLVLGDVGGLDATIIDVCSYPSQQPNSDPSDCVIIQDNSSKVELIKHLSPTDDQGVFNLAIDGTVYANNIGHLGTTGEVVLDVGNNGSDVIFTETAGNSTLLTNYTTGFECRDQNGQGEIIASGNRTGTLSRQITADVEAGTDMVCIVTNTRQQATLTLVKTVINDDGGNLTQNDFPVQIDTVTASWGSNTVNPGSYTVSETQQAGYSASVWGGDCDPAGHVTLANSENKTCTITNNDIAPMLHVEKRVLNDNGGTLRAEDFNLYVNDVLQNDPRKGGGDVADSGITYLHGATKANVTYTVSEDTEDGYTQTSLVCVDNTTQQTLTHPLTLELNQEATCTITNEDDTPSLTLIKNVVNDSGGTLLPDAFTLRLSGGSYNGSESFSTGATPTVSSNVAYTVSEDTIGGYEHVSTVCINDATNLPVNQPVILSPGQEVTCTVTNDDMSPLLTLIKNVKNDYGDPANANAWLLSAIAGENEWNAPDLSGDGNPEDGDGVRDEAAYADLIYTLIEASDIKGYTAGSWICVGVGGTQNGDSGEFLTLSIGANVTCTITNTAKAPQLTVIKQVINDNGGTATADDFTMNVIATNPSDSSFPGDETGTTITLDEGFYSVDEVSQGGYTKNLGVGCSGSIAVDEHKTCTITNDDDAPSLTLNKVVVNDNGGVASESEWTLTATGTTTLSGPGASGNADVVSDASFAAGTYTLSESGGPIGYTASGWSCTNDVTVNDNDEITLANGQSTTCTITNDDNQGSITVVKNIDLDGDNEADLQDVDNWLWTIGDSAPFVTGSTNQQAVDAGTYDVSEIQQAGHQIIGVTCGDRQFEEVSTTIAVTVRSGEDVVCTFVNQRDVVLNLTKSNNSPVANNGDTVTYTLTLNIPENSGVSFDTCVADILPAGFIFNGVWSTNNSNATQNVEKAHEDCGEPGGPSYGNDDPAEWYLGDVYPGTTIIMTYQVLINDDVVPGTYTNVAYASGYECDRTQEDICEQYNTPEVESDVTILAVGGGQVLGEKTGSVLGERQVLVNTGDSKTNLVTLLATVLLASTFLAFRPKKSVSANSNS